MMAATGATSGYNWKKSGYNRLQTKMPQIESGHEKASSDSLPCVDSAMIQDFFASNFDFVSAEGKITSEHKVKLVSYTVAAVINEQEEVVRDAFVKIVQPLLVDASMLNEEPSVTSALWYWKKSKLSTAAKTDVDIATLFATSATNIPQLGPLDSYVLSDMVKTHEHCSGTIFMYFEDPIDLLSLHQLILKYLDEDSVHSTDSFIDYARTLMSDRLFVRRQKFKQGDNHSLQDGTI
nr:unnamed protein product [Callosobruchus analis]